MQSADNLMQSPQLVADPHNSSIYRICTQQLHLLCITNWYACLSGNQLDKFYTQECLGGLMFGELPN